MKIKRYTAIVAIVILSFLTDHGDCQRNIVLNQPTYDQDHMFHFGFVLGVNMTYATIRPVTDLRTKVFDSLYIPDILPLPDSAKVLSINSSPTPGFVVSIVSDMKIGEHFDLRFIPSLAFGDRTIFYDIETYRSRPDLKDTIQRISITKKVPSTYINFPIEIKYKAVRYNNFRPYLIAGAQYSLDLASQAKKREQRNRNEKIIKFNQNDVSLEAGVGFDFYNEWFKFGLELKMTYGLFDMLKREKNLYTNSIDKLNTKIFQLSFTFE